MQTDSMPAQNEICRNFGWASCNAASEVVQRIVDRGWLQYTGVARGMKFAPGDSPWDEITRLREQLAGMPGHRGNDQGGES